MRTPFVLVMVALLGAGCADDDPDATAGTTAAAATSAATAGDEAPTTTAAASTTAAVASTTTGSTTSTAAVTTTPAPTGPALELDGRTFTSTAVTGFELAPGVQITLSFDGDRIAASGGCNQLASSWSVEGDVLVVAEVASTMMACEPATLMDQDTWLSALLASDPTVALEGDTLTLTQGQSSITLAATP